MAPCTKPSTSIDKQISLLQERKLIIEDIPLATYCLSNIGYYRLAGYWSHYQEDKTNHIFSDKARFEDIVDLYNFDMGERTHLGMATCRRSVPSIKPVKKEQKGCLTRDSPFVLITFILNR